MTDARDPDLQQLFDTAPRAAADPEFVRHVMSRIRREQKRTILAWVAAALVFLPIGWWLSAPVVTAIDLVMQLTPDSLVTVETGWLARLVAPVNSVTGIAGLAFLLAYWLYRKLIS